MDKELALLLLHFPPRHIYFDEQFYRKRILDFSKSLTELGMSPRQAWKIFWQETRFMKRAKALDSRFLRQAHAKQFLKKPLTVDEFQSVVEDVYNHLPGILKNRFEIVITEFRPSTQQELQFGYVWGVLPNVIVLCYWGFLAQGDFSTVHIERVIKHEVEHVLMGVGRTHSEHQENLHG